MLNEQPPAARRHTTTGATDRLASLLPANQHTCILVSVDMRSQRVRAPPRRATDFRTHHLVRAAVSLSFAASAHWLLGAGAGSGVCHAAVGRRISAGFN